MNCDGDVKASEWIDPPVAYHLSTIGIEEAFVVPPPQLAQAGGDEEKASNPNEHGIYTTWEIVGKIKSTPEDFIVREIGGVQRRSSKRSQENEDEAEPKVADLTDAHTLPPKEEIDTADDDPKQMDTGRDEGIEVLGGQNNAANKIKIDDHKNFIPHHPHAHKEDGADDELTGSNSAMHDMDRPLNDERQDSCSEKPISTPVQYERTREGVLRAILQNCILKDDTRSKAATSNSYNNDPNENDGIYDKIKKLYDDAVRDLDVSRGGEQHEQDGASSMSENPAVGFITIPPIGDNIIILQGEEEKDEAASCPKSASASMTNFMQNQQPQKIGNRNRGTFHRTLKVLFPLLKSSTLDMKEYMALKEQKIGSSQVNGENETETNATNIASVGSKCGTGSEITEIPHDNKDLRYIKVEKDTTFHKLVPFLLNPQKDLLGLYKFRNSPIQPTPYRNSSNTRQGRRHKRRQKKDQQDSVKMEETAEVKADASVAEMETLLYLKTDIAREQRKEIHHIIAASCRDFQTGTKNDLPINVAGIDANGNMNDTNSKNAIKTTAITVQWSRQAQSIAMKRKRKEEQNANKVIHQQKKPRLQSHTLCVLKKRQQEHLSAVNHLVAALKCRQSDVGLAGIKDMQAVTYQYCTLRNISPFRARKGNDYLKARNMELGNFDRVSWLLNQGDLSGNSFEIVIRDLGRVQTTNVSGGQKKERFVQCDKAHFDAMIDRIRNNGFVNFYGEQRVGDAGPFAGVRAGDIGRAMLQQNFLGAIDLLMKGRDKGRGGDFAERNEIRNVRKVYHESGGDPAKTLEAFPRGNAMGRERAVLQGLKRYGRDKPLEALRCLGFSVRTFWIHAYQSYIFNQMASQRIRRLGNKPVIGDLYIDDVTSEVKEIVSDPSSIDITQIVLPLPGYKIVYPTNIIGSMYVDTLKRDGVEFRKDAMDEATAKGSYRKLVVIPKDFKWEPLRSCSSAKGPDHTDKTKNIISDAKLNFSLPSGSYATICLRELMASTMARECSSIVESN